jgi:hypothetical protein
MPGPVTSKYDNIYWIRLFAILVIGMGGTYLTAISILKSDDPTKNGSLVEAIVLWAACGGIYMLYFHKSPPRQIVVSDENIAIYEYIARKRTIIKYTDIDSTTIFNQYSDADRFGMRVNRLQILQLELYNGEIYRISENDYINYDFLRNAIYDHLPNHRS